MDPENRVITGFHCIRYEGISHQFASAGTKVKVICKGQGQIYRLHFSKTAVSGAFVSSQTSC